MQAATISEPPGKTALALRIPAVLLSYIFHPIFIPIYCIAFLVMVHPNYFSGFSLQQKKFTIVIASLNLVFFPLMAILLLKAVGFIQSIFLHTQKDRIIPYMAYGIFSFWAYTVFKGQPIYPPIIASFILGIFLAGSGALIANIYFKISMHALGAGGFTGLFLIISFGNSMAMIWPLALVIFISGMVCTARMLLNSHTEKEIYTGFVLGVLAQVVSAGINL